jgi:hypothetical protein
MSNRLKLLPLGAQGPEKGGFMDSSFVQLKVSVAGSPEVGDEERADVVRRIRDELRELSNIETMEALPLGEAPEGSKAGSAFDWQTLVVTLAASGGVLTTLINAFQSILVGGRGRSITLQIGGDKLVITGIKSDEELKLIRSWVARHPER